MLNVEAYQNVSNITTTFSDESDGLKIEWYKATYSLVNPKLVCNFAPSLCWCFSFFHFSMSHQTVDRQRNLDNIRSLNQIHTSQTLCTLNHEPTIRPLDRIELMWQFLSFHLQSNIQNINFQFSKCHYRWVTVIILKYSVFDIQYMYINTKCIELPYNKQSIHCRRVFDWFPCW